MRTGIHEIREIHRKQLDAEQKYLEDNNSALPSHRRLSRTQVEPPESPTSPLSPPPSIARLTMSAFNLMQVPTDTAKSSDDLVLESFFGSDNMNEVNAVLCQSTDSLQADRKSQSTDRLLSAELPPLPERRRFPRGNPISRSPKTSRVHASTPDMSSLKRNTEPLSDVGVEMQKLRMRLRETANQTVAEIEEEFSPKFDRLTLGPAIDLPLSHAHSSSGHSHQGSLDSFPSPAPPRAQFYTSQSSHNRQQSLPLSAIGETQPHATSPPKSPSLISRPGQLSPTSPPSRSPTPPHQLPHTRQASLGSTHLSGLITTCYQTQSQDKSNIHHHQRPTQPNPYVVANAVPHMPPSMSRQYSPGTQQGVNRMAGMGNPSPEHPGYVYGNTRSLSSRVYSSNPNLLSGDSSTHYSTTVIKKRRPSGNKTPAPGETQNSGGGYDKLQPQNPHQQSQLQGSNHSQRIARTHSPRTQYSQTRNEVTAHPPNSYHNQRSVPGPSTETNPRGSPKHIKPYMSTGELRSSMRQFQYVPFADQKRSLAVGRGRTGIHDPENTWL